MSKQMVKIIDQKNGLVIRSATSKDAKVLTNWWNDGSVMSHAGFPNGLQQTIEQTIAQIEWYKDKVSQLCIIEVNKIPVGELSFGIRDGFAEIGIKICKEEYQNKGLGTIVLNLLIQFLFENPTLNERVSIQKIILDTNLNNLRAQHVYEKIGFTRVKVRRNSWKDQLGAMQSSVDYILTREQYEDGVRYITDKVLKEKIATQILGDLPQWFGLPDSTKEYIATSKEMPFFAYYRDHQYIGFIVLKKTGDQVAELYVMGVMKHYHGNEIGKKLFQQFVQYASHLDYKYLQVKTVEEGHYKEYDATVKFYKRMGFQKFECFPGLWDQWNPCLVMIQSVESAVEHIKYQQTVSLVEVNNTNMLEVLSLEVKKEQKHFVPSAAQIVARAWAYKDMKAMLYAIQLGKQIVGLALLYELPEEPSCYCLMELMIAKDHQNKGIAQKALKQIIDGYSKNPMHRRIELSVERNNLGAIHTYQKAGFIDLGNTDPHIPQYNNMVYEFKG